MLWKSADSSRYPRWESVPLWYHWQRVLLDNSGRIAGRWRGDVVAVSGIGQRVQVFAVGLPAAGCPRERRRFLIKWRVDGRDRTRSFKTRAEAERLRSELLVAVTRGDRFDVASGLPAEWQRSGETWWSWTQQWLALKWDQWAGHSRRSAVETLVSLTPLLIRPGAPAAPGELAGWLREKGFVPGLATAGPAAAWLNRWSVPLVDIDAALIEAVLRRVTTRRDGKTVVAAVARRRKNTLGSVLSAAQRRGHLRDNPMLRVEWRSPAKDTAVDVSTVASYSDVLTVADHVAGQNGPGARYGALFALIGIAGTRPSEALGLRRADLLLPASGWGTATLRGATPSPGARYTQTGERFERKALKQRAKDTVRHVPLAPELVRRLAEHRDRFAGDELMFPTASGSQATSSNYSPVWNRARQALWPSPHPLAESSVYNLRHAAATTMLRAGVSPAETAKRLGHSVDILLRVYAGVATNEQAAANELLDKALLRTGR